MIKQGGEKKNQKTTFAAVATPSEFYTDADNSVNRSAMNALRYSITIYGPMIYTAPYVKFLMRVDRLGGEGGGGLALEISSFVGPCETARADRRVMFRVLF